MRRLDELKRKEITQRDFEMFPVWAWGEDMESYVPFKEIDSPDEYSGALFIRAKLLAGGHEFDGYLVGNETFYAFGIFAAGQEFVFNIYLPDFYRGEIHALGEKSGVAFSEFFPVAYSSDVRLCEGRAIAGEFTGL